MTSRENSIGQPRRTEPGDREWMKDAPCRGANPDLFFPLTAKQAQAVIRKFCAGCPVRQLCYDHAQADPWIGDWGIWGGTTVRQRRRVRKEAREQLGDEAA